MIRAAKFADTPQIEALIRRTHERSRYAAHVPIHDKSLNQLVMGLIAGQNQKGPQASWVNVVERDDKIVGMMAGSLSRIYNIGDRLVASDIFLINEGGVMSDTIKLIDGYIAWAENCPKVVEIGLSWSDAVKGAEGVRPIYIRKGFSRIGEIFERTVAVATQEEAA